MAGIILVSIVISNDGDGNNAKDAEQAETWL
jgi:hypothetical protein